MVLELMDILSPFHKLLFLLEIKLLGFPIDEVDQSILPVELITMRYMVRKILQI